MNEAKCSKLELSMYKQLRSLTLQMNEMRYLGDTGALDTAIRSHSVYILRI